MAPAVRRPRWFRASGARRELDGDDAFPLARFLELVDGGDALLAEAQAHRALCALDAVGLGDPVLKLRDDRGVCDDLASHRYLLAVVQDLGVAAAAEILGPARAGQCIELVANEVCALRN